MYNVIPSISQQLTTIIWYNNVKKFSYDNYQAIFAFILILYMIRADVQLGKYYNFF